MKNVENSDALNNAKHADKKSGKRGIIITAVIGLFLLAGAGAVMYTLYDREQVKHFDELETQRQTFNDLFHERDSVINEWMLTFNQIEKDLQAIVQREKVITAESSDVEITTDRRQKILEDMKYINSLLDFNKKKIASLNEQLKRSGSSLQALQEKITDLEASVKMREDELSQLKIALVDKDFEIDQLNHKMTDLQLAITQKDAKINDQVKEMNKAFLAYGTYRDLNEMGLVTKEGGFLGIGRREYLVEDFADSTFMQVDITELKSIPVNSKEARLITEHPTTSYELIPEDDNRIAYIEIKDPDLFWKISRYAVVQVK